MWILKNILCLIVIYLRAVWQQVCGSVVATVGLLQREAGRSDTETCQGVGRPRNVPNVVLHTFRSNPNHSREIL